MTVIAEFPFDSNAIIVLVAVVFAAIKAFLERGKTGGETEQPDEDPEAYERYEAELRRQREAMEMPEPVVRPREEYRPPPLPQTAIPKPTRPKLSPAEKKALENLQLRSTRRKKRSASSTKARLYRHLSSPTAVREALLLAEILGPPKALKEER